MSISNADGFRTLQALRDLRILAGRSSVETRACIAAGIPNRSLAPDTALNSLAALAEGHAADGAIDDDILSAIRLASALPNDDFQAFILANMLLIELTLKGQNPVAEIDHHWSTFREHYRIASAVERAAIAQALRRISLVQDTPISMPQSPVDRTTASASVLKTRLERHLSRRLAPAAETDPAFVAALLIDAQTSPTAAQDIAELWRAHGEEFRNTMPEGILAGFRHTYEIWDGFSPDTSTHIPLLDPPPGVDWPH